MKLTKKQPLFIVTGASCVGKSTLCNELFINEKEYIVMQVIAKLVELVRNLEPKRGRIRAEHEFWNEKWIIRHFRRTLISYRLYESGKS